jgi:hypothetical protein
MPALDAHVQDALDGWMEALERRHLQDLTFQEVARALRALSSCYVERRHRLTAGEALEGAGKRAAFALFYGPLHFMLTAFVVRALALDVPEGGRVVDVGCGTGAAGAAWALTAGGVPLLGIDRNAWAAREAAWSWDVLRLDGRAVRGDLDRLRLPRGRHGIVAAFTANELPPPTRTRLRDRLLEAAAHGDAVLVVEPIARASAPWWDEWAESFAVAGGEERTWRAAVALPELVARFDRAAGLNHRELTGRSLHIRARPVRHP